MGESGGETELVRRRLTELRVPEAESVAEAFGAGDVDELARTLLLNQLWVSVIDSRRDDAGRWIDDMLDVGDRPAAFSDGAAALRRILDAGARREDVALLARALAYETTFSVLYGLNGGLPDPDVDDLWELIEDDFQLEGSSAEGLHESLLSADPSGREGMPSGGTEA